MKIDFWQEFRDLEGALIMREVGDKQVSVTLGYIAGTALMSADPNKPEPGEDKLRAYDLAVRVYKGGEQEVSAEEITLLKRKIGENMVPLIVGQAYRMLEQK